MGSLIHLRIGRLELDWGKNSFIRNHSALFTLEDVRSAPYYYADEVVEEKPAFVRRLSSIVRRLDLLGFTPKDCERVYGELVEELPGYYPKPRLTFLRRSILAWRPPKLGQIRSAKRCLRAHRSSRRGRS